ncbi:MAG: GH92 family glycosyl hydrolase [Prevotella sp.]|nr:GH92 family glycosyl hydrolase [Prevotella sp.]
MASAPVDYVNPYIGNISHLLVPTFPTVHLPNSMLRVYPERADYTSERVSGLPIIVTNHRERSAFKLMPQITVQPLTTVDYTYENERLTPYSYNVDLDDCSMSARLAVSHQSAIYEINFHEGQQRYITLSSQNGEVKSGDNWISGWQTVSGQTKVYVWLESLEHPMASIVVSDKCKALKFADDINQIHLRYGISFISEDQARQNLRREQNDYDVDALAAEGRRIWNETLDRIAIAGGTDNERTVFYSSYYRTFERPILMSEGGHYWSAYDNQVHEDGGQPFYTDDWIWDTYRAAHPLRVLTDQQTEESIIDSYLKMAEQMGTGWMPTFPEVNGDSRRMNSNHGVAMVADALVKGLKVDAVKAYDACRKGIEEKTLAPWSGNKAGWIDQFYKAHGYIPALRSEEKETDPNVNSHEKRQPVAVTLGTSYDEWCLSRIADYLSIHAKNKKQAKAYSLDAQRYRQLSLNYRNLWNAETKFFHPKDSSGHFIEPFDYRYSGGQGAREYYGENNGWTYRFDVQHNIPDLISLMGGNDEFVKAMDQSFTEPLGESKFEFYSHLPDHTGNVGMFSMANEPSFHIPYLYNYAGQPWKTQRCIRKLLNTWYRNDLMGIPGDEDGGGMTAFVVFSMMGFYPVTPGTDIYTIGSPIFSDVKLRLSNGKIFEVIAHDSSDENKYIQSARLNGNELKTPFISHEDIMQGGVLELQMGYRPNKTSLR